MVPPEYLKTFFALDASLLRYIYIYIAVVKCKCPFLVVICVLLY